LLISILEAEPIKAGKENLHEIKVALDDALVRFMTEEAGYTEDHTQMNMKLLVAFILNVIGGATALYAYRVPFEKAKFYTALGSLLYLAIYGVWNFYTMFLANQFAFCGRHPSKNAMLHIKTDTSLKDAVYRVHAHFEKIGTPREILSGKVDRWVTIDGHVSPRPFVTDMRTAISKISVKAD
jgi:hypothetical protein